MAYDGGNEPDKKNSVTLLLCSVVSSANAGLILNPEVLDPTLEIPDTAYITDKNGVWDWVWVASSPQQFELNACGPDDPDNYFSLIYNDNECGNQLLAPDYRAGGWQFAHQGGTGYDDFIDSFPGLHEFVNDQSEIVHGFQYFNTLSNGHYLGPLLGRPDQQILSDWRFLVGGTGIQSALNNYNVFYVRPAGFSAPPNPVPEPAGILLTGLALLALARRRF